MDWKDGLTTIIVVGLGYYGLTKVVKGSLYHADSPLTDGEGRIAPNECPYCGEDENWAELTHDEGGSWDCYYCGTLTYDAESFAADCGTGYVDDGTRFSYLFKGCGEPNADNERKVDGNKIIYCQGCIDGQDSIDYTSLEGDWEAESFAADSISICGICSVAGHPHCGQTTGCPCCEIRVKKESQRPTCGECGELKSSTPQEYNQWTCWPCVDRAGGSYHGTECYCSQCMSYENYAESFSADGYKGIPASKIEILKWYVRKGGKAGFFHDLPSDVQIRLQMGNVHELLEQDVNRWLQDHGHNPHMETPDWLAAEYDMEKSLAKYMNDWMEDNEIKDNWQNQATRNTHIGREYIEYILPIDNPMGYTQFKEKWLALVMDRSAESFSADGTIPPSPFLDPDYCSIIGSGKYRFNQYGTDGKAWRQYRFKTKDEAMESLSGRTLPLGMVKPGQDQYDFPPKQAESFSAEWTYTETYHAAKAFAERHKLSGAREVNDIDPPAVYWPYGWFENKSFEIYVVGNTISLQSENYDMDLEDPGESGTEIAFFPLLDSKWDKSKTEEFGKRWAESHKIPYTNIHTTVDYYTDEGKVVSMTNDECYLLHDFVEITERYPNRKPKTEEVLPNCKVCGIPNPDYVAPKPPEPICGVDMPHQWTEPKAIYTEDTGKELIMGIKSICVNCDKRREVNFRKEWSAESFSAEGYDCSKYGHQWAIEDRDIGSEVCYLSCTECSATALERKGVIEKEAESFAAVPISGTGSPGQMCGVCDESDDLPYDSDHFKECRRCGKSVCLECWGEMESDEHYYEICGECWIVLDNVARYDAESHAYTYAYNEGHSDSRKTGEYRPSLGTPKQEGAFKRILKQKGE